MSTRLTLLPEPRFLELRASLESRLAQIAGQIQPGNFASLLDPMMREVVRLGFAEAQAQEGTVWLLSPDQTSLVPAYNTGPHADRIVETFAQPLGSGLVCMVFASEQPFVENEVSTNAQQSKLLDHLLQVQTQALMVVPFYFLRACRGVISCVQLKPAPPETRTPPGFTSAHLATLQRTATLLSSLIEFRLLSQAIGWSQE